MSAANHDEQTPRPGQDQALVEENDLPFHQPDVLTRASSPHESEVMMADAEPASSPPALHASPAATFEATSEPMETDDSGYYSKTDDSGYNSSPMETDDSGYDSSLDEALRTQTSPLAQADASEHIHVDELPPAAEPSTPPKPVARKRYPPISPTMFLDNIGPCSFYPRRARAIPSRRTKRRPPPSKRVPTTPGRSPASRAATTQTAPMDTADPDYASILCDSSQNRNMHLFTGLIRGPHGRVRFSDSPSPQRSSPRSNWEEGSPSPRREESGGGDASPTPSPPRARQGVTFKFCGWGPVRDGRQSWSRRRVAAGWSTDAAGSTRMTERWVGVREEVEAVAGSSTTMFWSDYSMTTAPERKRKRRMPDSFECERSPSPALRLRGGADDDDYDDDDDDEWEDVGEELNGEGPGQDTASMEEEFDDDDDDATDEAIVDDLEMDWEFVRCQPAVNLTFSLGPQPQPQASTGNNRRSWRQVCTVIRRLIPRPRVRFAFRFRLSCEVDMSKEVSMF